MRIGIIGAGMAGLGAASHLQAKGHEVRLFDKGRGAGGRMATRRLATPLGEALFDHGAQYFTVRDPQFAACVETWQQAGLVARWPVAGDTAFVGTPSMNAPLRAMADRLAVTWSAKVDAVTPAAAGWTISGDAIDPAPYNAVVMAIPAEQASVLLRPIDCRLADLAASAVSEPCWTVMAAFADPLPGSGDILPKAPGPIGWAARNRAKPGRSGPEAWV
ncbi:MAG: NAD(P)/FAD-dependent oxidoreductase, partial [Polymorphobacter sp.]